MLHNCFRDSENNLASCIDWYLQAIECMSKRTELVDGRWWRCWEGNRSRRSRIQGCVSFYKNSILSHAAPAVTRWWYLHAQLVPFGETEKKKQASQNAPENDWSAVCFFSHRTFIVVSWTNFNHHFPPPTFSFHLCSSQQWSPPLLNFIAHLIQCTLKLRLNGWCSCQEKE